MVARETRIAEALARMGVPHIDTGPTVERLDRITALLETAGVERGLVSARDTTRILTRHVLECAGLQSWLPQYGQVVDVGSGAGLPGLVLAALRSEPVILIEAASRRAAFLREVSEELGLHARVVNGRAEVVARGELRGRSPAVVARALARPPTALELTLPFAAVGGLVALLVGSDDAARARGIGSSAPGAGMGVAEAAEELGGGSPEAHGFEVPGAEERRWVMIVRKLRPTPDRYPRTAQAMKRRPLGGGVA